VNESVGDPDSVGVPASVPVDVEKVIPAGSVPEVSVHVVTESPGVSVAESATGPYAVPTFPAGNELVEITGVAGRTWKATLLDALVCPTESVAETETGNDPNVVGVPDSVPEEELNVIPVGNGPEADHPVT
jgi:hypothetical protein